MTTVSPRQRRRALGLTTVTAVLVAAAIGIGYAVAARPKANAGAAPSVSTKFVAVTRGTVTERVQVSGVLGYDGSYPVVNQAAPGILTAAAVPGTTVSRGGVLYTVDNQAVRLLYGPLPAYRGFAAGMSDGPDVAQLEANLVALGHGRGLAPDQHFSSATADAIRRWQAAWGLPASQRTGTLDPGRVVFLPGALRISQLQASVGTAIGPNAPVLATTSTNRVVTAQVTADRQALVHAGDRVLVSLPGSAPISGTVTRVGRVATAPTGGGPQGNQPMGPATVPVTIGLTLPAESADLDQAPVQVAIASAQHTGVLLVPVTALLARPGGGYQVRLASGGFVQVRPGLFDDSTGLVEVAGDGLTVGVQVEVPAS